MSDVTRPAGSNAHVNYETKVSLYDRVSGGLIAMLVLGLFLFATLFLIWWFHSPESPVFPPPPKDPTTLVIPDEVDEINVVEFEGSESQSFEDVIALTGTSIAELSESKLLSFNGDGDGIAGEGDGTGIGKRQSGPSSVTKPKWSVTLEAANLKDYQQKLDYFGIEIAAVHKSNSEIWKIADLSGEKVVTKSSRSAESKRRYFVNQRKRLLQWDRQTIAQAGVDLQDVLAVHFYPNELIVEMQQLINQQYPDQASDLKAVTFKITGTPEKFQFAIEDAQFEN